MRGGREGGRRKGGGREKGEKEEGGAFGEGEGRKERKRQE